MKDRDIFERTTPEPWTILGLRLRPFALGHLELLHRIESAFVLGGQPTYDDLALSVFICSRTYEDAVAGFSDPGLPLEMGRWAKKLTGQTFWRKGKPIDLVEKWLLFCNYLKAHSFNLESGKDYVCESGSTRRMRLPMVHAVRIKLQYRGSFSDSEIFNRPWALCLLDYYGLADMDGVLMLIDEEYSQTIRDVQAAGERLAEQIKDGRLNLNGSTDS